MYREVEEKIINSKFERESEYAEENKKNELKQMMLPELFTILEEVKKIDNIELEKYIKELYQYCNGENINLDKDNIIRFILERMFPVVENVIMLPFEFLNTNVYKLIAIAKIGINQEVLYTKEVMAISGYGRVYILDEVRRGKLKASKHSNRWVFEKNDVLTWLDKKNNKRK